MTPQARKVETVRHAPIGWLGCGDGFNSFEGGNNGPYLKRYKGCTPLYLNNQRIHPEVSK